jgi:Skp family chaperone for outer membrane proteins
MLLCSSITKAGARCRAQAIHNSEYCINHDPGKQEARRLRSQKGGRVAGRGRASHDLKELKARFEELAEKAMNKGAPRGNIAVAVQALAQARMCIRDGLLAREQEALALEVEEMREAVSLIRERNGSHYGTSG